MRFAMSENVAPLEPQEWKAAISEVGRHQYDCYITSLDDMNWCSTVTPTYCVLYVDASRDEVAWGKVLDMAADEAGKSAAITWNAAPESELAAAVRALVPWQIARIQVAKHPRARRLPVDIVFRHRLHALRMMDGSVIIESESVFNIAFPTSRFAKPVDLAVLVYGTAEESEAGVAHETEETDELRYERRHDEDEANGTRVHRVMHKEGVSFVGLNKDVVPYEVRSIVARLHETMAHPSRTDFLRFAGQQGASPAVMSAISALRCATCEGKKPPGRPRPAAMPEYNRVGQFGDRVYGDVFYCDDARGKSHMFLGFIDELTLLHIVARLNNREAKHVWETAVVMWMRPYGIPAELVLDQDGSFFGCFEQMCGELQVFLRMVPAEAHWQLGKIERHNCTFRMMLERVIDFNACWNAEQLDLAVLSVCNAKNAMVRRCGRSPFQAAFGRAPRLPAALLSDESQISTWANMETSTALAHAEAYRCDAIRAFVEVETSTALRSAVNRQTSIMRGDYQPGMRVCFWRTYTRKNADGVKVRESGYVPATFMFWDPGTVNAETGATRHADNNAWVSRNGRAILVAREQLRPATTFENWTPTKAEIDEIAKANTLLRQRQFQDLRGPPPDATEPRAPDLPDLVDDPAGMAALFEEEPDVMLPALELPVQSPPAALPDIDEDYLLSTPVANALGDADEADSRTSSPRASGESSPASAVAPLALQDAPATTDTGAEANAHPSPAGPQPQGPPTAIVPLQMIPPAQHDAPTPVGESDAKKARTWITSVSEHQAAARHLLLREIAHAEEFGSGIAPKIMHGWDGSPSIASEFLSDVSFSDWCNSELQDDTHLLSREDQVAFEVMHSAHGDDSDNDWEHSEGAIERAVNISDVLDDTVLPEEEEAESSEEEHHLTTRPDESEKPRQTHRHENVAGDSKILSRKEQKSLDREIPWRSLIKEAPSIIDAYVQAVKTEAASWKKWGPVRPLSRTETRRVLNDKSLRRRVLRSRMCYRDKNCGRPPLRCKARCVVTGFLDPDLRRLTRYSPTPTRLSAMCVCQCAVSGFADGWKLITADVSTAFLQGRQQDRAQPLYMRPPHDPIVAMSGEFADCELYEVLGNVYGLANAPYLWSCEVRNTMCNTLCFRVHSLDAMMFLKYFPYKEGETPRLCCICIFHVDDMLCAYHPRYCIDEIRQAFTWGSWDDIDSGEIKFAGRQMRREGNTIIVFQSDFILSTPLRQVIAGTKSNRELQTASEYTEYRSCGGSLQWLSGQSRPDISAATSLLQTSSPELSDLQGMYGQIKYLRDTAHSGIRLQPVPLDRAIIVGYGDSSWANAPGFRSQGGLMVILTHADAMHQECDGSILDWKSSRSRRVLRSTLAAEAAAADAAVDHMCFAAKVWGEIIDNEKAASDQVGLPTFLCTDCKSLFDSIKQLNPSLEEKRTIIDLSAIRECLTANKGRALWVPTSQMWADALTKVSKSLRERLTAFMDRTRIALRNPEVIHCDIVTAALHRYCQPSACY